jgi:hypothetical protein
MKRKAENEKEQQTKEKFSRVSSANNLEEEIPATPSPEKKQTESDNNPIPEYKMKLVNKSLNRIKESGSNRSLSLLSSPSIMSSSSSKARNSSPSICESFVAEMKAKVQEKKPEQEVIDVEAIFEKLKKDDGEDKKEVEGAKGKPTDEEKEDKKGISCDLPMIATFQTDLDWSKVGTATVKHLKSSCTNLRLMINELNEAK